MASRRRPDITWSELSAGQQRYYRNQGISPATFNAWRSRSQLERAELTRQARRQDYSSGLQRAAVRARVKKVTGHQQYKLRRRQAANILLKRGDRDFVTKVWPALADKESPEYINFWESR